MSRQMVFSKGWHAQANAQGGSTLPRDGRTRDTEEENVNQTA